MLLKRALPVVALLVLLAATVVASTACAGVVLFAAPGGAITATSLGALTFTAGGSSVTCNVTFSGSFEGQEPEAEEPYIEGIAGTQAGQITSASASGCTGGTIEAFSGLPWRFTYSSSLGTLPNSISGTLFTLSTVRVRFASLGREGQNCLYSGSLGMLWGYSGTNPYSTTLLTLLSGSLSLAEGQTCICPASGRWEGTLSVESTQTIEAFMQDPLNLEWRPAEAGEAGRRVDFGRIERNRTATRTIEIRSIEGLQYIGQCTMAGDNSANFINERCPAKWIEPGKPAKRYPLRFDPRGMAGEYRARFELLERMGGLLYQISLIGRAE